MTLETYCISVLAAW